MKKISIKNMKGFTLVELLIVITLIAILSVAVLATINPIEQTNKAKDSANMNDAAEMLNAYERYYANQQKYPWMMYTDNLTVDSEAVLLSTSAGFGICYATGVGSSAPGVCNTTGTNVGNLIISDELKPSFANKNMFKTATLPVDRFWTIKASGSNGSLNVCFIPKSKSSRQSPNLVAIVTTAASVGLVNLQNGASAPPANSPTLWAAPVFDGVTAIYRCVPE